MGISREEFIKQTAALTLGFSGLKQFMGSADPAFRNSVRKVNPFGPLKKDPNGIFNLPEGFSYQIISKFKDTMDDGFYVPHRPDGMATFKGPNGYTILIRNHEVNAASGGKESAFDEDFELAERLGRKNFYDFGRNRNPGQGGTTTVVYDTQKQQVVRQYLSLAGTIRNCAGGPTPWNSWLTCEETTMRANKTFAKDHGYVFEVPAQSEPSLARPLPIKDMGRFNHEAVAVDPGSGIVYQTEDEHDSLLYRYIPNDPGKLRRGGKLQALAVKDQKSLDTRNWEGTIIQTGEQFETVWIDLDNIQNPDNDLRYRGYEKGAARFARGEGMWYADNTVYFACTEGGQRELGQIWKLALPDEKKKTGILELFVESNDRSTLQNPDNLTVAPWGHLVVCEDTDRRQDLIGITPKGNYYRLGRNAQSNSELAGAVFSPDGSTLFMNIQHIGLTLAITGPWEKAQ